MCATKHKVVHVLKIKCHWTNEHISTDSIMVIDHMGFPLFEKANQSKCHWNDDAKTKSFPPRGSKVTEKNTMSANCNKTELQHITDDLHLLEKILAVHHATLPAAKGKESVETKVKIIATTLDAHS